MSTTEIERLGKLLGQKLDEIDALQKARDLREQSFKERDLNYLNSLARLNTTLEQKDAEIDSLKADLAAKEEGLARVRNTLEQSLAEKNNTRLAWLASEEREKSRRDEAEKLRALLKVSEDRAEAQSADNVTLLRRVTELTGKTTGFPFAAPRDEEEKFRALLKVSKRIKELEDALARQTALGDSLCRDLKDAHERHKKLLGEAEGKITKLSSQNGILEDTIHDLVCGSCKKPTFRPLPTPNSVRSGREYVERTAKIEALTKTLGLLRVENSSLGKSLAQSKALFDSLAQRARELRNEADLQNEWLTEADDVILKLKKKLKKAKKKAKETRP